MITLNTIYARSRCNFTIKNNRLGQYDNLTTQWCEIRSIYLQSGWIGRVLLRKYIYMIETKEHRKHYIKRNKTYLEELGPCLCPFSCALLFRSYVYFLNKTLPIKFIWLIIIMIINHNKPIRVYLVWNTDKYRTE